LTDLTVLALLLAFVDIGRLGRDTARRLEHLDSICSRTTYGSFEAQRF
jgi:hypothetical protein